MKIILLATGAAALAITAGAAGAAAKHSAAAVSPKQPVPYSQLDAYLKASPKARASKDWWSGEAASTGAGANTSATAPASSDVRSTPDAIPEGANPGKATSAAPASPPIDTPPAGQVNPTAPASPDATPGATSPK